MKTFFLAAASAAVIALSFAPPASAQGAVQLQHECVAQAWLHPNCAAWMGGVAAGVMAGQIMQRRGLPICPPRDLSNKMVYLITRRFMATHPRDLGESAAGIVAHALFHAYPCR